MAKIAIFGITGFTGKNIQTELLSRGHSVVGVSPSAGGENLISGSIFDSDLVSKVSKNVDVVLLAIRHSSIAGTNLSLHIREIAENVNQNGAKLFVIGGAGSLKVSPEGPMLIETPNFPDQYKVEATAALETLQMLQSMPANSSWTYLSPSAGYGSYNPGERKGEFRISGDVLLKDDFGTSYISGEDLAIGVVDEIENPRFENQRFTLGY